MNKVSGRNLGVVAGGMYLPRVTVESAKRQYANVCVVRLIPFCEENFEDVPYIDCKIGALRRMLKFFRNHKVDDIVINGTVKRAPLLQLGIDASALLRMPTILRGLNGGDDKILTIVVNIFEKEGFRVIGTEDILPEILAPNGAVTNRVPKKAAMKDIHHGMEFLAAASPFDIGQSVVVDGQHILAVEASEGTEAMLRRVPTLTNRYRRSGGVLVKSAKLGQELRIDRPTIGPATVEENKKSRAERHSSWRWFRANNRA